VIAIGRTLRAKDSVVALGLVTAAMLLSPPGGGALSVAVVITATIASTGGALQAIRRFHLRGIRSPRLGSWVRATAALGVSASIMLMLDAGVAAIG
jgi:hypothetical protein